MAALRAVSRAVGRAVAAVLLLPIRVYRRWISPWTPPTCRFTPTCSAYAEEALRTLGPVRAVPLILWRVARCQPFCRGGHDPVPEPPRTRAPRR